jgi:hypothetical protein
MITSSLIPIQRIFLKHAPEPIDLVVISWEFGFEVSDLSVDLPQQSFDVHLRATLEVSRWFHRSLLYLSMIIGRVYINAAMRYRPGTM